MERLRTAWRQTWDEERAARAAGEGRLVGFMAALPVFRKLVGVYLLLALGILLIQFTFFDTMRGHITVYGGREGSEIGDAGEEIAEVLNEDFGKEAEAYRLPKTFTSDAKAIPRRKASDPSLPPTKSSAERLGRLAMDPYALVIVQDGFKPDFVQLLNRGAPGVTGEMTAIKSLDVRAVADLWDSYMHVVVGEPTDGPRIEGIAEIKAKGLDRGLPILAGEGVQLALARRILCQYGVFPDDDAARAYFLAHKDIQAAGTGEAIEAVRSGRAAAAFLLTSSKDIRDLMAAPAEEKSGAARRPIRLLPIDRAEAIIEAAPFAEVVRLPWDLYQDHRAVPRGAAPRSIPERPSEEKGVAADPEAKKGLKTLKTQTILACSSHLPDGVVATILRVLYARLHTKSFHLPPRPPADQKFLYPMHDAAHAFHKGGPAPGFITSPFIVGALALILGQLLQISSLLRERKSRRFIRELKELRNESESVRQRPDPGVADAGRSRLTAIHRNAVDDFAHGRLNKEGYERIKEYHVLLTDYLKAQGNGPSAGGPSPPEPGAPGTGR